MVISDVLNMKEKTTMMNSLLRFTQAVKIVYAAKSLFSQSRQQGEPVH